MNERKVMKKYEIILFDADNTLLDFDADMDAAFEETYYTAGLAAHKPYSKELLQSYYAINESWWRKFEQGKCTKPELYGGRFQEYITLHGFSCDAGELNERYFINLAKGGRLLPGAMELVKSLAPHYRMYIVTNGNASSQEQRLQRCGLMDYITDFYVSEAVGAAKPDIRYFRHVFNQIDEPDKTKYLLAGDSLTSDILGAQNAGIDSIWYNPGALPNVLLKSATYEVRNLDGIKKILLKT